MSSVEALAKIDQQLVYGLVLGITLWSYDWVLTIKQEIQYVWSTKWTPGKVLFLGVRYGGFVTIVVYLWTVDGPYQTPTSCKYTLYFAMTGQVGVIGSASIILALRTWAIWNRTPLSAALLLLGWVGFLASSLFWAVKAFQTINIDHLGLGLPGCSADNTTASSADAQWIYVTLASYEGLIVLMTIARGLPLRYKLPKLTETLYRDAFLASTCLLTLAICNLALAPSDNPMYYLTYLISLACSSVLPARIVLNLREATMDLDGWDMTTAKPTEHISFDQIELGVAHEQNDEF